MNLNYQINKFIVKITKSKYLGQDAGDCLRPNLYHSVEVHRYAVQFGYTPRKIGNRVRGCR